VNAEQMRDELVMTLRLHHISTHVGGDGYWEAVCACGWRSGRLPTGREDEAHCTHRADALMPRIEEWLAVAWDEAIEAFGAALLKPLNDNGTRDMPPCPYRRSIP
jgi:hypothetical protein